MYKTKCTSCGRQDLKSVVNLGQSPLANNLLTSNLETSEMFPLEMMYCGNCNNCQLSYNVPSEKMFSHYLYVSSTAKAFREHFETAAKEYVDRFNLGEDSFVIDIGSNDGIALIPLQNHGVRVLGVEPAANIVKIAQERGVDTIQRYFNTETSTEILNKYGQADVVTASNVFAHASNLDEIATAVFALLKAEGTFIVEVQYLLDTIKDLTFDNIYHEHVNYWSVTSLVNFFNNLQLSVVDVEHVNTHGGSIRVYVQKSNQNIKDSVKYFLDREKEFGLTQYETYVAFAQRVENAKLNVRKNIKLLKQKGLSLVGYGAPAKATTSLNYFGVTFEDIDYIVEDNKLKHNTFIPGVNIPIYSKDELMNRQPDVIIVMAWNFFEDIKNNNKDLVDKGIKFISIKELQNEYIL
jgi:SAM-dependent methyltransferase